MFPSDRIGYTYLLTACANSPKGEKQRQDSFGSWKSLIHHAKNIGLYLFYTPILPKLKDDKGDGSVCVSQTEPSPLSLAEIKLYSQL